ncbi:MAG: M20/M25/M40 family metallo-hydrolase [Candidatus Nanopelagicales bacterium]
MTDDLGRAAVDLTRDLVAVDSVNPGLVPGAPGERAAALLVADRLDAAGYEVALVVPPESPDRVSLLAVRTAGPGPAVVLNGHLDTVGVDGMDDPFTARIEGQRMYGRGTCDMKAGVAGQVVAAEALAAQGVAGTVVCAFVADEEDASLGTETVIETMAGRGLRADVCLVGEPTWLDLAVAHRGYALVRATIRGRGAHTSRPEEGVDAIAHLGRLLAAVREHDDALHKVPPYPLLGHGSLLVSVARGGSAPFTIAAEAEALVERRTLPGEPVDVAVREVRQLLRDINDAEPLARAEAQEVLARDAWEADSTGAAEELMGLLRSALPRAGAGAPSHVGAPYWMESALWQRAGIPAVVCGPAGGGLHAVDEWVDLRQVAAYPVALVDAVGAYLTGT